MLIRKPDYILQRKKILNCKNVQRSWVLKLNLKKCININDIHLHYYKIQYHPSEHPEQYKKLLSNIKFNGTFCITE